MRALFCATAIALVLAGCSWIPRLGVYKLDINQGNYVTSDQVDRLKVGQTKQQVRAFLGTPMLTARRNFPADTNGSTIWLAGGYASDNITPLSSMEIMSCAALSVTSTVSRKVHGACGTFDINMPLSGSSGVECRTGGGTNDYTLVVTFSGNVTVNGTPQGQVTVGTGCVGTGGVCSALRPSDAFSIALCVFECVGAHATIASGAVPCHGVNVFPPKVQDFARSPCAGNG